MMISALADLNFFIQVFHEFDRVFIHIDVIEHYVNLFNIF